MHLLISAHGPEKNIPWTTYTLLRRCPVGQLRIERGERAEKLEFEGTCISPRRKLTRTLLGPLPELPHLHQFGTQQTSFARLKFAS